MTNRGSSDARTSKNQRRDAAREKARILREKHQKKERRSRFALQATLILVTLAIIATVTLIIVNSIRPPAPGPRNMLSDGIVIGQSFAAVTTPALQADDEPVPTVRADDDPIAIEVYLDYQCPFCQQFEQTNADQIGTLLEQGVATLEIHPVAILDNQSAGGRYSTRAANAAACVANFSPDSFYDFNALLFENQPEEQTPGLTDEELIAITEDAGVTDASDIEDCITGEDFENWVAAATDRATSNRSLAGESDGFSTPTVLVNGDRYPGAPNDASAFAQFVAAADSEEFIEENSESTSPSPAEPSPVAPSPAPSS